MTRIPVNFQKFPENFRPRYMQSSQGAWNGAKLLSCNFTGLNAGFYEIAGWVFLRSYTWLYTSYGVQQNAYSMPASVKPAERIGLLQRAWPVKHEQQATQLHNYIHVLVFSLIMCAVYKSYARNMKTLAVQLTYLPLLLLLLLLWFDRCLSAIPNGAGEIDLSVTKQQCQNLFRKRCTKFYQNRPSFFQEILQKIGLFFLDTLQSVDLYKDWSMLEIT